jgi:hypothetical protein
MPYGLARLDSITIALTTRTLIGLTFLREDRGERSYGYGSSVGVTHLFWCCDSDEVLLADVL